MEYSALGLSLSDPSLPNITNVTDILPSATDVNRIEEIDNPAAETVTTQLNKIPNTITVAAQIHSELRESVVAQEQANASFPLFDSQVTFDEIIPYSTEEIISDTAEETASLSTLHLTGTGLDSY